MRIGKIDIPKEVIDAQACGKLVIFAGAGVSMPPPSNYPDFKELAKDIAAGTIVPRDMEPIDQFLGRLEKRGVKVHQTVRNRLSDPKSRPNPLHYLLTRIASGGDGLHLVTTNFDKHFSTAAKRAAGEIEAFFAPALPLGDRFQGVVYLHGSVVSKDERRLVLTDEDFAMAYLTEGWARRFLLSLFREYTVLFVGYSHDDTVMSYLARGLPQGDRRKRYAFTPDEDHEGDHWEFLGITPIPYPKERNHLALQETLEQWARRATFGALDHDRRIKEILSGTPPLVPDHDDYLKAALTDPYRVQFFVRHAKDLQWLTWAEDNKALDSLFAPCAQLDDCQRQLAYWVARGFASEAPENCLSLLLRKGQRMNPILWEAVTSQFAYGKPSREALAKWVPMLVRCADTSQRQRGLWQVLRKCSDTECTGTALLLFGHLTRFEPILEEAFSFFSSEESKTRLVNWGLAVPSSYHDFTEVWKNVFEPQIVVVAVKLASIIARQFEEAYGMLGSVAGSNHVREPFSWRRSAIEPHGQDHIPGEVDGLIDFARDTLEWLAKNRLEESEALASSLIGSDVPLLRRLAIHSITESSYLTPDEKVEWVLSNKLLYADHEQHEVFRLLQANYSPSSEPLRVRMLDAVALGPTDIRDDVEGLRSYIVYKLAGWLHQAAPDCHRTLGLFERLKQEHPDFSMPEYPDLRHPVMSSGLVGGYPKRMEAADVVRRDVIGDIDWLLSLGGATDDNARLIFVQTIAEACAQDREWGWLLCNSLRRNSAWESQLWDGIFAGLGRVTKTTSEWRGTLSFLEDISGTLQNVAPALRLLRGFVANTEARADLPIALVVRAERVFSLLWPKASHAQIPDPPVDGVWYFAAADHVGGVAVKFWVFVLWRHLRRRDTNEGLPRRYQRVFESVLSGDSPASEMACAMSAYYMEFFYSLDETWAQLHILPLLDWSADENGARWAWHCYLNNSRINLTAFQTAMDYYRQTFQRLDKLGMLRERFVDQIALFAVEASVDPLAEHWLDSFIDSAEPGDRERWAWSIWHHLKSLKPEAVEEVWHRWLDKYWGRRVSGMPTPLEPGELRNMLHWLPCLRPVFSAAVLHICSGPPPDNVSYHELAKIEWLADDPQPLADLLHFLLENSQRPFCNCEDAVKLVKIVCDAGVQKPKREVLCNKLCELGCRSADELEDFLR